MTDKERKSCINTIETLKTLAYNIHGTMDVIDAENCDKVITMLDKKTYCSCWSEYPNESFKKPNGKWKCVDKYRCVRPLTTIPLKCLPFPKRGCKTKCERIESEEE